MNPILALQDINIASWLITALVILAGFIAVVDLLANFFKIIKKPLNMIHEKNEDHNLLLNTIDDIKELKEEHINLAEKSAIHDEMISKDLKKLTDMFIEKSIDDMRYEILDFASALSSGRIYSKEQFTHVIKIYEKYEKVLEENNMSNGQVTASMEVINDLYKKKLITGF